MSDRVPDRAPFGSDSRQAVCVHTQKITDCCLDKDCVEDLRVYLTPESQNALNEASSAKARCCELLYAYIDLETIPYNSGHYTVDITFYYKILGDVTISGSKPTVLCGLAIFSKRVVLCGETGKAKSFSSKDTTITCDSLAYCDKPEAVVDVVDPMILAAKVMEHHEHHHCEPAVPEIPAAILACMGGNLVMSGEEKRFYVTLGQFSTVRLQRDTQLQIPNCKYCIPTKECCDDPGCVEDPCEMFSKICFPTDAFFPADPSCCG